MQSDKTVRGPERSFPLNKNPKRAQCNFRFLKEINILLHSKQKKKRMLIKVITDL